ncbi:MAG: radical SAM protein [Methanosarcinales archaeon]
MPSNKYPILSKHCTLRYLETPLVYDIVNDQLYELDLDAYEFLKKCDGSHTYEEITGRVNNQDAQELIEYALKEGILEIHDTPKQRDINTTSPYKNVQAPLPSLRYLLIHLTTKCNLKCKHCYLAKLSEGNTMDSSLDFDTFKQVIKEFDEMQGLKVMLSGGEPLLHSQFWDFLEILKLYKFRIVVLSNGTLIDGSVAKRLSDYVNEVQVSVDGIKSHDMLRGEGTFKKALSGIKFLKESGIEVSIASMVHKYNVSEFENMQKLFSDLEVCSWSVDVPCRTGNLKNNIDFVVDLKIAAKILNNYGFGVGAHESTGNYTCGSHICTIMPNGTICKCGFFADYPVGTVKDGLKKCWKKICKQYLWTVSELECRDCPRLQDCHGGCRYRAKDYGTSILSPDPVLCNVFGVI